MKYIKQRSKSDCGVACLCMIAWHFGKKLPYTELFEQVGADKSGSSVFGVCEAAKHLLLEPTALTGTAEELISDIESGRIELPVIARIVNRHNRAHFIVISTIKKAGIGILDPDESIGRQTISREFFKGIFLGEVISFRKQEGFYRENRHKNPLLGFLKYALTQKAAIISTVIASIVISAVGILSSLMLRYLVDDVLYAQSNALEESVELFALMIMGMAMLYALRLVLQIVRGKLSAKLINNINGRMITDVYSKMMDLPLRFFNIKETGELMSRFSDASKINQAIASIVLTIGLDIVMVIASGFMIHSLSHTLFMYALAIAVVYAIISFIYMKPIERANREVITVGASINSYLKESTDDVCTLKACTAEGDAKKKFTGLFTSFKQSVVKAAMKNTSKNGIIELIGSIGTLALLWVGCMCVVGGSITAGTLISVYSLLSFFTSPIQGVIELQSSLQEAYIAAERLEDIVNSAPEKQGDPTNIVENGAISFHGVSFSYQNSDPIFSNFSFEVSDGDSVAIVGASGCGKSTAAKLLTRFYETNDGSITVGGIPVGNLSLHELRSKVVYVPQDVTLFADTLRRNLTLGIDNEVSDEELIDTLEMCGCDFISRCGMGLDSIVEEGGTNFSGGQLKRLAIARALLRRPKVVIFDETTANLSESSVRSLTERINALPCTKIWITHNPEKISGLDYIIDFDSAETPKEPKNTDLFTLKAAAAS